jgi:uncharacterized protein YbjT (DUF2867 family)
MPRTALLLGATGLVGGELLTLLLADPEYRQVTVLVRRNLPQTHPKLVQRVVDFKDLPKAADAYKVDDVFCCLGTTIKKAGSQEAFRVVDYTYPLESAKLAARQGAGQYLIITALGADAKSSVFYNRVKGEVEEAIGKLPLKSLHIFRPSLLLGNRQESRTGEKIAIAVMKPLGFLLAGPLKKYRGIQARTVALAMLRTAKQNLAGRHAYNSDVIQGMGK